ncbi:MAG: hemolysin III family protein [Lachnospiraceae bacterium]|nr:hemolysin III family protein [Lachnospiraceae bacterium]
MTLSIREPGSALTHFVGVILTILAAFPLLLKSEATGNSLMVLAMSIFIISMVALYLASTLYHTVTASDRILRIFRKVDHMMIFILIAGSYTPFCLITLHNSKGNVLLAAVWICAFCGMLLNVLWITCPKWLSSIIYITMGWLCVWVFKDLYLSLPTSAFYWLLIGGVVYTVGGVIYALKLPLFPPKKFFGNHELFHVFVLIGSMCHFICMYTFIGYM